jgi:hypothetical protein
MGRAATLAATYDGFLADATHLDHLRPHTLCTYRYELALAAAEPRFASDLDTLSLADLEAWLARPPASPSTVSRRAATFCRFFAWALRHESGSLSLSSAIRVVLSVSRVRVRRLTARRDIAR